MLTHLTLVSVEIPRNNWYWQWKKRAASGSTRRGSGAELNAAPPPRSVDHGAKIVYIPLCVTRTSPPRRRRPPPVAGGNKMWLQGRKHSQVGMKLVETSNGVLTSKPLKLSSQQTSSRWRRMMIWRTLGKLAWTSISCPLPWRKLCKSTYTRRRPIWDHIWAIAVVSQGWNHSKSESGT